LHAVPPGYSVAVNVAVSALISTRISDSILFMLAAPIAVDIAIHPPYLSPHRTVTSVTGITTARTTGIAAFGNDIGRLSYISTFTPIYPCACACATNVKIFSFLSV
jgi:hypothetical protein